MDTDTGMKAMLEARAARKRGKKKTEIPLDGIRCVARPEQLVEEATEPTMPPLTGQATAKPKAKNAVELPEEFINWDARIEALRNHHGKYGSVNVPRKSKEFPELATWVEALRRRSPKSFTESQRRDLEQLGFTWSRAHFEKFHHHWRGMYLRLRDYKRLHGDFKVSLDSDAELANWIKNQRARWRDGKLAQDRIKELEKIGFVWRVVEGRAKPKSSKLEAKWQSKYAELVAFHEAKGHSRVPKGYAENTKLGDFVQNQRTAYKQGKLRPDRKELLEKIDFDWAPEKKRLEKGKK